MFLIEKTQPDFPYSSANGIPLPPWKLLLLYTDVNEGAGGFVPCVATSLLSLSLSA